MTNETKTDIIDVLITWGQREPGIQSNLYVTKDDNSKLAQFYSGVGYNNYERTGVWLACLCVDDEGLRIWGPTRFGGSGGLPLGPSGEQAQGNAIWWLKPADPDFFEKLRKVLFRFHRRKP